MEHFPLVKDSYHFYLGTVTNLLLLVLLVFISNEYRVAMNTEIDNEIYVFNYDGTFIKFSYTKRNVYCMYTGKKNYKQQWFFIIMKGMEMKSSIVDQKQLLAIWALQECLRFPNDVDLADAIECNMLQTSK